VRITIKSPEPIKLDELAAETRAALLSTMQGYALIIANDARRAIASPPKTGRIYGRHQASAPGEAPASDTGTLLNSISGTAKMGPNGPEGVIEARAPYAAYLEYGTRKMLPRPYLTPAIERNRQRFTEALRKALETGASAFARKQR